MNTEEKNKNNNIENNEKKPLSITLTILFSLIGLIVSYFIYPNFEDKNSNQTIPLLLFLLSILAANSPIAIYIDDLLKTKETLKKIPKFTSPPSILGFVTLVIGFFLVGLSYWLIIELNNFLYAITSMAIGSLFVVNSLIVFIKSNLAEKTKISEVINSKFIKSLITIVSFSGTAYAYGNINASFPIDPTNFPLTLTFIFGFFIFFTVSILIQFICVSFFLSLPPWKENKGTWVYWSFLYVGTFFFWGSFTFSMFLNPNMDTDKLLKTAAYNLDYNENFTCKPLIKGTTKVIFLGPNHKRVLSTDSNFKSEFVDCTE
jgi:hypothetical protein